MHSPLARLSAARISPGSILSTALESVAEETPIALTYNGHPYAVMMATPRDLADFAIGFSLTEGIVESVGEIELVDQLMTDRGISMEMLIPQRRWEGMAGRHRNLAGRTGCGLCGIESLTDAVRPVRPVRKASSLDARAIGAAFQKIQCGQPLNDECGGLHAAAVVTDQGDLLIREDVGRHNAVDKALGAVCRSGQIPSALLATSRASYEVVHKAAQLGCSLVATISAPTALAIRLAQDAGLTLVGFARQGRVTVYAGDLAPTPVRSPSVGP